MYMCMCVSFQACTLARRNADVFLKYMHRNSVNMPGMLSHVKAPEQQVKSEFAERCRRTGYLRMFVVIRLQSIANKWLCLWRCFSVQTHCTCCFPAVELLPTRVCLWLLSLEAYLNTAGLPTEEICVSFFVCLVNILNYVLFWHLVEKCDIAWFYLFDKSCGCSNWPT